MAKLCDLPSCFMQGFLKANPNSLVDSNGYLRSEYEAELARRNESVAPSSSVPDPRTFRPQFECTGETATISFPDGLASFELPDEQLGIVRPEVMAHAEASIAQNAELLALLTDAPAPRTIDWNKASKIIEQKTGYDIQEPLIVPADEPIKLADITPELSTQIHSEVDKGWEATIAQAESDAGIDGEPAASEPHE